MNLQKTHRRCALVFSNKIVLLCFYRKTMNDPSSAGRSVFIVISVSHSNVLQHVFETLSLINSPHSGVTVQFRYVSPGVLHRQQIAHFSVCLVTHTLLCSNPTCQCQCGTNYYSFIYRALECDQFDSICNLISQ